MFVPWRKQTNKPLRMSAQYGTIASQLDETNFLRWFLKYVNWGIFQDTKQITVYGLQEQQSCTRRKFQKKSYRREPVTVLLNACVCTSVQVTSSREPYQTSYHLIHSHHIMQKWQGWIIIIHRMQPQVLHQAYQVLCQI